MSRLILISLTGILSACYKPPTCEEYANSYRFRATEIVVTERSIVGRIVKLKGYDPRNEKKVEFNEMDGHFIPLGKLLRVGDTLSKKAGQTDYIVRQPGINVALRLNCDSPVSLDTLRK